jgi:hypothetical protein
MLRVDPNFYAHLDATNGVDGRNSLAIMELVFDDRCPKDFYPVATKRKVRIARWLLLLSPVLIVGVLLALLL